MTAPVLDEKLILNMADGDASAFREFYEKTSSAVYGFALSILRNRHDAEDVMHDTYIKAYTGAVTYRPGGKPLAWLLTIVRNLCLSRLRSGRVFEDISELEIPGHDDAAGSAEDRQLLERALRILGDEERQIVILHAVTGMKHREIAEIVDMPVGTVLSKYNRSMKKMKEEIMNGTERGRQDV